MADKLRGGSTVGGNIIWHAGNDGTGSGLDADLLDGLNSASTNTANTVVIRDGSGNFSAGTITATLSGAATRISFSDRRSVVQTPSYFGAGVDWSFMGNTTDGLSDGGSYHGVMHYQPYSDASGGGAYELGFTDNNNLWLRGSSGALTAWAPWVKVWTSGNDGTGSGLDADLLDGLNSSSSNVVSTVVTRDASGNFSAGTITASSFSSSVVTGTAPLTVASVTKVTNLNADLLDGLDSTGFMVAGPDFTGDLNTLLRQGSYRVNSTSTNAPTADYYSIIVSGNNGNVTSQTAVHFVSGITYIRAFNNSWSAWAKVWTDQTDGTGSGLDADLLDGQHGAYYNNYTNLTNIPSTLTNIDIQLNELKMLQFALMGV